MHCRVNPPFGSSNCFRALAVSGLVLGLAFLSQADGWSGYRGPNLAGVSRERVAPWAGDAPKTVWKATTTDGFSCFSVAQGKALTLVKRSLDGADREVCIALDCQTGKELWATPVGISKYDGGGDDGAPDNKGGDGPRSTPTIDGDRVYTLAADLNLACLSLADGKEIWSKNLTQEHGTKNISWKNAASPLIEGDLILVCPGGEGAALMGLKKSDGTVAWKSAEEKMTHASPIAGTIHGVRQAIFFVQSGLVSVAPDNGRVLWKHPFRYNVSTAASAVVCDDIVYCSAGYGVGSCAARIEKNGDVFEAKQLWRLEGNKPVANHWSTPVFKDGYLYGMFSFKEYGKGPLKCVEVATGKVMWEQAGFGAGQVILAGDTVVALGDAGQLVLVKADPKAYTETARAKVVQGKCWSSPSLSDGRLYVRSTKEGACLDLSGK